MEKLLRDPVRGPGAQARAMVRGYVAGANEWLRSNTVTDPACRGAGYPEARRAADRPLVRRVPRQPARLDRRLRQEIVDAAPPSPDDPGLPELPVRGLTGRPRPLLKALGRDPESPFGSNATAVGGAASTTGRGMLLGNLHFPWRGATTSPSST